MYPVGFLLIHVFEHLLAQSPAQNELNENAHQVFQIGFHFLYGVLPVFLIRDRFVNGIILQI